MALWGKTDTLAASPKWVARKATFDATSTGVVDTTANTINLIPSNTGFNTGDEVVYSNGGGTAITGLTNGATYYVRVVGAGLIALYDTYAHAIDLAHTTGVKDLTAVGVGASHTLQRTGAANVAGDHINVGTALIFVDAAEAVVSANRAKGIKSPGWWAYRSWTNADGSVAHHAECLVAMNGSDLDLVPGTTGDREDTIAEDLVITINTQPDAGGVTYIVSPAAVTLSVEASSNGDQALAYQWYNADGDVAIVGATTATVELLNITAPQDYYVIVSAAGVEVTSNTVQVRED